jgi:hypothetical protein
MTHAIDYINKVYNYAKFYGQTLYDLAVASGYCAASISNWKTGRRGVSLQAFLDLCEVAGLEVWLVPKKPGPGHIVHYLTPQEINDHA